MAQHREHIVMAEPIILEGLTAEGRGVAARAAAICAATLSPALLGAGLVLLTSACMDTATLICALVSTVLATALLGATGVDPAGKKRPAPLVLLVLVAVALGATLLLPSARAGFYALANGFIDHVDNAYSAYVPYLTGTSTCANSPLFGICLGAALSVFSWLIAGMAAPGISLIVALITSSVSIRLGLGATGPGCVLVLGAWIGRCRAYQLPGSTYSLRSFVANTAVAASCCIVLFAAICAVYTPQDSLEAAREAFVATYRQIRYGHDTLPGGDLTHANSMNTNEDGSGLTITYQGSLVSDLYLRGYTGATFKNNAWAPLTHEAYEGDWRGMSSWLATQGLVTSQQRSTFDDEAASAQVSDATGTAEVEIDASRANRRYVYTPYTLRELTGATMRSSLEGSLAAGFVPASTYSETIDVVDKSNILADTSWLATSGSTYAQAERVYAGFVEANYLELSDSERTAATELIFTDSAWDSEAATEYDVIARVRTMLKAMASYTTTPVTADSQDGSFIRWFLAGARKGNSSYFATAAVLAFRSQGIPARYAEGYRADGGQLAAAVTRNEALELTAADAHAWAEVYLDGIGWTPVEVTPGFYTQAVDAEELIDVGEAWSNGNGDVLGTATSDEAAGGNQENQTTPSIAFDLLRPALSLITLAIPILVFLALLPPIQRAWRIARRTKAIEADDQDVCVPALYAYLSAIMLERGIGFNEARPLDCEDAFDGAFTGIDAKEYCRVIELHQAYAFGGQTLRPNELRTLRRFTERLHAALPAPKNLRALMRRMFARAL